MWSSLKLQVKFGVPWNQTAEAILEKETEFSEELNDIDEIEEIEEMVVEDADGSDMEGLDIEVEN